MSTVPARSTRPTVRSLAELLAPLDELASHSPSLLVKNAGRFTVERQEYELPRYLFIGPQGGDEPIRIGLFGGIHGDEVAGSHAIVQFLTVLEKNPELARGYCIFAYPVCNPTGYEDNTRHSRRGRDLNREFWNNTNEPEVALLQSALYAHAFHGIISLHTADSSHGAYGFVGGATLTEDLLRPALNAAADLLPLNESRIIDGFNARDSIIRESYQGVLSAPPKVRPRPFEIVFETPHNAPQYIQERACVVVLETILAEYRKFIAYASNL